MESNYIKVRKTARYFTLGSMSASTKYIWVVCHGYGQLANYFIKKFEVLADERTHVIAPEALNRFYLQGFSGRVGATWMTKEERLTEIDDYVDYLNQLYDTVLSDKDKSGICVNVVGFSQGVATVCRWIANGHIKIDNLVLWAGQIPVDMNLDLTKEILSHTTMYVVYGKQDEFLTDLNYKEYLNKFTVGGFNPHVISFDGKHEIHQETLLTIRERIISGNKL